jgi:hypothetical protein
MTHVFDSLEVDDFIRSSTTGPWNYRAAVRAATVVAGTLASDFENGDTIDGVSLATGDRILIKNQVSGIENGIYIVNATGAPTRAGDMYDGDSVYMTLTFVKEGTVNNISSWFCSSIGSDLVGTDALTFKRFGTFEDGTIPSGTSLSDDLDAVSTYKVINLPLPTAAGDSASKEYVDSVSAGLDPKESVRTSTVTAADLANWTRAGSGVGKTLTAPAAGTTTLDGVLLADTNRVLVKNSIQKVTTVVANAASTLAAAGAGDYFTMQGGSGSFYVWYNVDAGNSDPAPGGTGIVVAVSAADADTVVASNTQAAIDANGEFDATVSTNTVTVTSTDLVSDVDSADVNTGFSVSTADDISNNGIYVASDTAGGSATVLTRSEDQDGAPAAEASGGNFTFVEDEATVNGNTGWVVAFDGTLTIDEPLTTGPDGQMLWVLFSASGDVIAGDGLSKVGNTLAVNTTGLSTGTLSDDVIVRSTSLTGQVLRSEGGAGAEAVWGALDLSSNNAVTGTLAGDHGGTGQNNYANNDLLVGSSPSSLSKLTTVRRSVLTTDNTVAAAVAWRNVIHVSTIYDPAEASDINILDLSGTGVSTKNWLDITNQDSTLSTPANNPRIKIATSSMSTNVGINFEAKGTGAYNFLNESGGATKAGEIRLWDIDGSNYIGHQASATTSNSTYSWPNAPGSTGLVLTTDTGGVLSWVDPGTLSVSSRDFSMSLIKTTASKTTATTIAYFPWDATDLGGGSGLTLTFWHEAVVASQDLVVEVFSSVDGSLGSTTIATTPTPAIGTISIFPSTPGTDAIFTLTIRKTSNVAANPSLTGAYLTWAA